MSGNSLLQFAGIANMLDREYRNTPRFQWARELVRNGIEADATKIRIGIEWQALSAKGVYRLQYADDGIGMDRDQLRDYMRTLGKGSKVVGGPHDNYALGCRMTLLPWNPAGVVVISQVAGGEPNMVKFEFDPGANEGDGEYVLVEEEWENPQSGESSRSTVYPPYVNEEEGFNWADTVPDIVTDAGHGTTFILLGATGNEDTVNGDPGRNESLREMGRRYFNTRFWDLPDTVDLKFLEIAENKENWPRAENDPQATYQWRTVRGAKALVNYKRRNGAATLRDRGMIVLPDGTKAHWWLRHEPRVDTGGIGGSLSGFLAVLYRNELYNHAYANRDDGDTRVGASVYRLFGIGHDDVRKRVFIVLEPPEYDEATGDEGVAPSTGRADLYWVGHGISSRSVKVADWAEQFGDRMPRAIQDALREARDVNASNAADRDDRLKRVMERFSKRWLAPRGRVTRPRDRQPDTTTEPTQQGTAPRTPIDVPVTTSRTPTKRKKRVVVSGRGGDRTLGPTETGDEPATTTNVTQGYPDVEWVRADDINDPGMIAAWQPRNAEHPNGLIELDETHPLIQSQIRYWQEQYAPGVKFDVEKIVKDAYEDVAVAKVAHMHSLARDKVFSEEQRENMLVNPALTTSLLGLISEDAVISPRLGGLGTKRRRASDA